jgi:cbb3-type cytochrome oxidase subunit 3
MNIKPLYLIIATIFLASAIWFGLDRNSKYQAERESNIVLQDMIEDTEAENNRLRDSVKNSIQDQRKERAEWEIRLDSFETIKPEPRYDKSIDTIRNSNRIDSLFARYYR